jgi:NAD(P)-dependent dehydrogenase (short-subunit alcohol dehydrogenase family)
MSGVDAGTAGEAFAPAAPDALAGRVILVTGAYGSLGEYAAKACAQAGATVVLLGRKVPKLSKVYDAVKALGPQPAIYPLDLAGADPADYEQLAERIVADLGGLHGILHCAAEFTGLRPLETTPPEDFVRNLHVNLTAPWLLSQACLPALRAQADSAIVFLLDDPARVQRAYWGPYGIAKSGLLGLMHVLDDETDNGPVRVSALQPRPMHSNIRSRAFVEESAVRVPSPLRTAHACVHLLSPAGSAWRGKVLSEDGAAA